MSRFTAVLLAALLSSGCELSVPLGELTGASQGVSRVPPVDAVDCDRDGRVSYAELEARFTVNGRGVTIDEFGRYDWNGDQAWNAAEFQAFLNQASLRAWSVPDTSCP